MSFANRMIARAAPFAVIVAAAAGVAASAGAAQSRNNPLTCEIRQETKGGMVTLEGVVIADADTSGSYRLAISGGGSGGSSTINQGGGFAATAGAETTLGRVMVGAGGLYDVKLEIDAGGYSASCAETIGGKI